MNRSIPLYNRISFNNPGRGNLHNLFVPTFGFTSFAAD